jgi:hypothetical protein
MDVQPVDPRHTTWEQDHASYRVCFWDTANGRAQEYDVTGADADEVLTWAGEHAATHAWTYTAYVNTTDDGQPGLIRLSGVLGDPFTDA